jgi:hypothetical protein
LYILTINVIIREITESPKAGKLIRNDDGLVGMWKEVVMAFFRYCFNICLEGGMEEKPQSG